MCWGWWGYGPVRLTTCDDKTCSCRPRMGSGARFWCVNGENVNSVWPHRDQGRDLAVVATSDPPLEVRCPYVVECRSPQAFHRSRTSAPYTSNSCRRACPTVLPAASSASTDAPGPDGGEDGRWSTKPALSGPTGPSWTSP